MEAIQYRSDLTVTPYEQWQTEVINFEHRDSKGRVIGMRIRRWEGNATAKEDDAPYARFFNLQPGHYFIADTQPTRNGSAYGAGQPTHYFATVEERETWIQKRIVDSRKAAAKKGGAE